MKEPLIKDYNSEGRTGYTLPELDIPEKEVDDIINDDYLRNEAPDLPEVSEVDVVRHYTSLSEQNYSVDSGIYPLGSCTMKYNPRINEKIARLEGFAQAHPLQQICEGSMELLYKLSQSLCEICGMDAFTLTPAAGAQGELTGILLFKKYFET